MNGMITTFSCFVTISSQHVIPFFKLLGKESVFEWNEQCEASLTHLKQEISQPLDLSHPEQGETLYCYLYVPSEVVSVTLIMENKGATTHLFHEKSFTRPKTRNQKM